MSLEQSMEKLAESNLKLAKSFDRYADVVEKFGLKIEKDNEGRTPAGDAPAGDAPTGSTNKPGRGRPAGSTNKPKATPAPEPEAEDDDGFGEEEEGNEDTITAPDDLTHDQVKAKLLALKKACGDDKGPALKIIAKYGYETIPSVKEKHFAAIWVDAETAIRAKADE